MKKLHIIRVQRDILHKRVKLFKGNAHTNSENASSIVADIEFAISGICMDFNELSNASTTPLEEIDSRYWSKLMLGTLIFDLYYVMTKSKKEKKGN